MSSNKEHLQLNLGRKLEEKKKSFRSTNFRESIQVIFATMLVWV